MAFKDTVAETIIPSLSALVEREREHVEWLKQHKKSAVAARLIVEAEQHLRHFELRLEEYRAYAAAH